jgi:hypothetical protein
MTKMPWSQIRTLFTGEWVELVDITWHGDGPYPQAARVRNHHPNRQVLLRALEGAAAQGAYTAAELLEQTTILFIGPAVPVQLAPLHHSSQPQATSRAA